MFSIVVMCTRRFQLNDKHLKTTGRIQLGQLKSSKSCCTVSVKAKTLGLRGKHHPWGFGDFFVVVVVLGINTRALNLLGKYCIIELCRPHIQSSSEYLNVQPR